MSGLVIRTFLVEGDPEGLRTMDLSNATAVGTFFPRPALKDFLGRDPANRPGVYVLFGPEEDAADSIQRIYIGEGDPVGPRLRMHGVQKDFWTQAAVFTSSDDYLTKTQIQFLEASLIGLTKTTGRATLENGNLPVTPNISEADQAVVETFLSHVLMLLGAAGYRVLRPRIADVQQGTQHFLMRVKDAEATMVRGVTAYVVLKGSTAVGELVDSARPSTRNARERLIRAGTLIPDGSGVLRFTKDTEFESPSGGATQVSGRETNGRTSWRLADGTALGEVEEAETAPTVNR
jgi:hypothetical protein